MRLLLAGDPPYDVTMVTRVPSLSVTQRGHIQVGAYKLMMQISSNKIYIKGYWTDNGAYYYYKTLEGMNYEDSLIEIDQTFHDLGLPIRYLEVS